MLILVAVTINATLNGGIISKAKSASSQTEVSIIQETLMLEKASKIAGNNGNAISDYGITLNSLDISQELKTKYSSKLTISKNGTLYYKDGVSNEDATLFESMGITKEVEEAEPIPNIEYNKVYGVSETENGVTSEIKISFLEEKKLVLFSMILFGGSGDQRIIPYTYDKESGRIYLGDNNNYAIPGNGKIVLELDDMSIPELPLTNETINTFFNNSFLANEVEGTSIHILNGTYKYNNSYITINFSMDDNRYYMHVTDENRMTASGTRGSQQHETEAEAISYLENTHGITLIEGTNDAFMKNGNRYELITSLN